MNELELDIDNLTDEEVLQLTNEIDNEYETWNVNLDNMINNLSDNNKIFLLTLSEQVGDKIFYMIYGYLNSESLVDYDEMTDGGMSEFINELDSENTLNFIELLIGFKKQEIELTEDEVDFDKIIVKLKRDVSTLKKKLSQPSKYINTKQFEERFGLTRLQQKGLRGKIQDPLPHTIANGKTILYDPEEVGKWLENYKKK
ncbi:MAG: hypothetical protein GQ570_05650 [Helicobacteraceae bacterium]|nr:hypothetical protein [Helicobacteraceae bacterium]